MNVSFTVKAYRYAHPDWISPETLRDVMLRGIELGEIVDEVKNRKEFIERLGERAKENGDRYQSRTCEDSCIRSGHFHGGICSTTWNHHVWRSAGPEEQEVSTGSKERLAKLSRKAALFCAASARLILLSLVFSPNTKESDRIVAQRTPTTDKYWQYQKYFAPYSI